MYKNICGELQKTLQNYSSMSAVNPLMQNLHLMNMQQYGMNLIGNIGIGMPQPPMIHQNNSSPPIINYGVAQKTFQ